MPITGKPVNLPLRLHGHAHCICTMHNNAVHTIAAICRRASQSTTPGRPSMLVALASGIDTVKNIHTDRCGSLAIHSRTKVQVYYLPDICDQVQTCNTASAPQITSSSRAHHPQTLGVHGSAYAFLYMPCSTLNRQSLPPLLCTS